MFITITGHVFHNYAYVKFQFQHNYIFQQRGFHNDTQPTEYSAGPQMVESTPNFDSPQPAMHTNPYNLLFPWIPLSHPTPFHPSSGSLETI